MDGVSHQLLDDKVSFQMLCPELDKRVLKAIAKLGFVYPTLVQVRLRDPLPQRRLIRMTAHILCCQPSTYGLPLAKCATVHVSAQPWISCC